MRLYAVMRGCDYAGGEGFQGIGTGRVVEALKATWPSCATGSFHDAAKSVIQKLIATHGPLVSKAGGALSEEDALRGAVNASVAFLHAPALDLITGRVVCLSGNSEVPRELQAYLGFTCAALNVNPLAAATDGALAVGETLTLPTPGDG